MESTKKELAKLTPSGENQKGIIQRTAQHLDEGIKAIAMHQKHIRIVDGSDLGWAVVEAYMDDKLASDLDDERKLYKAGQEAQQAMKRKWAESAVAAVAKKGHAKHGATDTNLSRPKISSRVQAGDNETTNGGALLQVW